MKIGRLDKRITIEQRSDTKDAYGQKVLSWNAIGTVWANIKPIGARERLAAMAYESVISHTVAIRYNPDFLPVLSADSMRIIYGTRTLQITGAHDLDEARRHIIFDCIEGRNG